jgi:outer membrane protein TolC
MAEVESAWAARRDTPQELARQRLEAARGALDIRRKQFEAGRGWYHLLIEAERTVLDAELELAAGPREREMVLATKCVWAREFERLTANQLEAGQVRPDNVDQARCQRLAAQYELGLARAARRNAPPALPALSIPDEFIQAPADIEEILLGAVIEAQQTDVRKIAEQRLEAARACFDYRRKQFQAGRGTMDLLLETARLVLDAELALAEAPRERVAARARYWLHVREAELQVTRWLEAIRTTPAYLLQARATRLEAQYELIRARAAQPGQPWPLLALPDSHEDPSSPPVEPRRWLDELHEIDKSDQGQIARQRLEAAREAFEELRQRVEAGRGTLDIFLEMGRMYLKAELVLAETPAARTGAWERHLKHLQAAERMSIERLRNGQNTPADVLQARCQRLEGQLHLARIRSGQLDHD